MFNANEHSSGSDTSIEKYLHADISKFKQNEKEKPHKNSTSYNSLVGNQILKKSKGLNINKSDIPNDAVVIATQTRTKFSHLDKENVNHNVKSIELDKKTPRNFSNLKVGLSTLILVD
jgi:hypothetical protein